MPESTARWQVSPVLTESSSTTGWAAECSPRWWMTMDPISKIRIPSRYRRVAASRSMNPWAMRTASSRWTELRGRLSWSAISERVRSRLVGLKASSTRSTRSADSSMRAYPTTEPGPGPRSGRGRLARALGRPARRPPPDGQQGQPGQRAGAEDRPAEGRAQGRADQRPQGRSARVAGEGEADGRTGGVRSRLGPQAGDGAGRPAEAEAGHQAAGDEGRRGRPEQEQAGGGQVAGHDPGQEAAQAQMIADRPRAQTPGGVARRHRRQRGRGQPGRPAPGVGIGGEEDEAVGAQGGRRQLEEEARHHQGTSDQAPEGDGGALGARRRAGQAREQDQAGSGQQPERAHQGPQRALPAQAGEEQARRRDLDQRRQGVGTGEGAAHRPHPGRQHARPGGQGARHGEGSAQTQAQPGVEERQGDPVGQGHGDREPHPGDAEAGPAEPARGQPVGHPPGDDDPQDPARRRRRPDRPQQERWPALPPHRRGQHPPHVYQPEAELQEEGDGQDPCRRGPCPGRRCAGAPGGTPAQAGVPGQAQSSTRAKMRAGAPSAPTTLKKGAKSSKRLPTSSWSRVACSMSTTPAAKKTRCTRKSSEVKAGRRAAYSSKKSKQTALGRRSTSHSAASTPRKGESTKKRGKSPQARSVQAVRRMAILPSSGPGSRSASMAAVISVEGSTSPRSKSAPAPHTWSSGMASVVPPSSKQCSPESTWLPVWRLRWIEVTCQNPGPRRCLASSTGRSVEGGLLVPVPTGTVRSTILRVMARSSARPGSRPRRPAQHALGDAPEVVLVQQPLALQGERLHLLEDGR